MGKSLNRNKLAKHLWGCELWSRARACFRNLVHSQESVQILVNAGYRYGCCMPVHLLSRRIRSPPEAIFKLQAVLSVPQNLSWPVWLTASISCPPLIDFLSFTHCFQALISSTWSLFLKTRNLLFTDHMLPAIVSQFRERSQESDSGTRSDGLAGNAPSSCPRVRTGKRWASTSEMEGGKEEGKMSSLHADLEAGWGGIHFISAFSGTGHHLNSGLYHTGWSDFHLTLLIFPRPPIFLMLFSRLYWNLNLFSSLRFLLLLTLHSWQSICLTPSQSQGAESPVFPRTVPSQSVIKTKHTKHEHLQD